MSKKKLLIIHGWGSNPQRWQKTKEILEAAEIKVLIPALPGFGKEAPPDEPWGIDNYKNWILDFVKRKGWDSFNLLGHSFGGGLAVKIATDAPRRVKKIILCSPAIFREKDKKTIMVEKTAKIGKKVFQKIGREKIIYFLAKIFYRLIGSWDYYRSNGVMRETIKRILKEDLSSDLQKLQQPMLLLWGEKDRAVPLKYARKIKREIEKKENQSSHKVKLVIFPKKGHALNLQAPEKIAEEVIKFLSDN